ncbi:EAL domain-containing protein [Kordiimonas aestuarii]|uniref:EAL domain-containing protein n=1 Tax=Kordiimonas aestuarii TaxID=1005925 RepID=UPI0021D0A027|nr:EAL domain-containing protein [Kordiimonas aestuarii]
MPDESLYPHVTGIGHAFFWCANDDVATKVRTSLVDAEIIEVPLGEPEVICFLSDDMESLLPILEPRLSVEERRAVRALLSGSARPGLREFGAMQSLQELGLKLSARWLGDMLADRRYKSLLQPIVSAEDHGDVLGYEFLIRGLHTDGVEIPAPVLFETAEDAGMLYALDLAAGESALRTAKRFDLKENVFVNVLPFSVDSEEGLNNWLKTVLGETNLPHEQLVFEIVESQQFPDFETLQRLVSRLKDHGIRIALDDFGTGFNNLATITQIQPDFIKLDKSLTRDLLEDGRKWTLVANIVDSAKQSNIKVIAEGVEDKKTARMLESAGVDFLQGYLFGYPADNPL